MVCAFGGRDYTRSFDKSLSLMVKPKRRVLQLAHSPSPHTQILCRALAAGFREYADEDLELNEVKALAATADQVLDCAGLILFCTENFGYMSGGMKDFFDRNFYALEDKCAGLPYLLCVRAGRDGTGAVRSVSAITQALGWRAANTPLVLKGDYRDDFEGLAREYAATFAAALSVTIS